MNKLLISYSTERELPRGHVLQFNLVMEARAKPKTKALECWHWPSPALAFYSAGPQWNWPDIMPRPLSFKHLPKGRGCQIHHNITLLRIHSQRSEAFWPKLFPLFPWFIWKLWEKNLRLKKKNKCNSTNKKKSLTKIDKLASVSVITTLYVEMKYLSFVLNF